MGFSVHENSLYVPRVERCTTRAVMLLLALLLAAAPARAQVAGGSRGLGGTPTVVPPNPAAIPLDGPVGRAAYALGPGDVVDLSIFGELNQMHRLVVTPEGTLVIPAVGVVDVLALNLDEAQSRVQQAVLRYFRGVGIHLTLSQLRQFKVFVLGDVEQPGVRVASAATRASEVVPPDSLRALLPRNVLLRRASGDSMSVDLVRFRQLGDLAANPMLREGDALIVPTIDETVRVLGRVAYPGTYEHRPGETLAELLTLANGGRGFPADAADSVRLSRVEGRNHQVVHILSRADALGAAGRALVLEPFDALYIPAISDFKQQYTATVVGQVANPGTYPIVPERTTVRELVQLAGGFAPDASLTGAALRRQRESTNERTLRQLKSVPPELLSSAERRILQASSGESQATNVVVDFEKLFAELQDVFNQALQSGDTLFVPQRRSEVTIVGAVLQPGVVQHRAGYRAADFVRLAGGYSRKADRGEAVVIKAGTGIRINAGDARSIDPGDMIIVPFKERRDYLRVLQTTSNVAATISGLVLTILALARL